MHKPNDMNKADRVKDDRDRMARSMGFDGYEGYEASKTWASIKAKFLAGGRACEGCGRPADDVIQGRFMKHDLDGSDTSRYAATCVDCGLRAFTRDADGAPLSHKQAIVKLRSMGRLSGVKRPEPSLPLFASAPSRTPLGHYGNPPFEPGSFPYRRPGR